MGQVFAPPVDAVITLGTPTTGAFPVTVQLKGPSGVDMAYPAGVFCYLAKDSAGMEVVADQTDTTDITTLTDGLWLETIADVAGMAISEADGDIGFTITVASGKHAYLVVVLPTGRLVVSDIMSYRE